MRGLLQLRNIALLVGLEVLALISSMEPGVSPELGSKRAETASAAPNQAPTEPTKEPRTAKKAGPDRNEQERASKSVIAGIFFDVDRPLVSIGGRIHRVGDQVDGATISEIRADRIVLRRGESRVERHLSEVSP